MDIKVIGILKNISELIVATLVNETETSLVVKNPAFLGIGGQDGQVNINFIPIEMLSISPPVNLRSLLANPTEDILYTFAKDSVLNANLALAANVVENYTNLTLKQAPQTPSTEENIVKLF
jgi:hypothetical protein